MLNVGVGVEYQMTNCVVLLLLCFDDTVKCFFGHLQDLEKVGDFITKLSNGFTLLFDPTKYKKVNEHSTACRIDMMQT